MTSLPGGLGMLASRLEWLRLMGVGELRAADSPAGARVASLTRGDPVAIPAAGRREVAAGRLQPTPQVQPTLFGGPTAPEGAGARHHRRDSGREIVGATTLALARPPEGLSPAAALALIREELGDCRRCRLCEKRTTIVFGVGSPEARLMFVGEGPGADEDRQGEPFVGRAGQLLTRIIESMGLAREKVYIANVVKCRPPDNRTPLPDEVATCSPFLLRQIAAIRPRVVVCLGTPAAQTVLGTRATITSLRGTFKEIDGIQVMPTFHPAYLLRNPAAKKEVWEDMKKVMALLETAG